MPNALFTCIKSKDYDLELVGFFLLNLSSSQKMLYSFNVVFVLLPGTILPEQPGCPAVVQPDR